MKKTIYLDIDMDYFIEPIEKASVDNIRLFHDKQCTAEPIQPLVDALKALGLSWAAGDIHGFTNHKKSYTYWWMIKEKNATVIHVDAHSDLYRNREKDLRKLGNGDIGCYNYLWYGLRDSYINEIFWVLPKSLECLLEIDQAGGIVHPSLIKESWKDQGGLHIQFQCIDIYGEEKNIPLHICLTEMLPAFDCACRKVTIATSPEFIPAKADDLVFDLFEAFGAGKSIAENIYQQHRDMLLKSPQEYKEAWDRLLALEKK